MNQRHETPDEAIGDPVLPAPSVIGSRNAALGGTTPRMGATSIFTLGAPPTTTLGLTPVTDR